MSDDIQQRSDPPPPANTGFDMNQPTIVSLLYLASFVFGLTGIVGVVLAYVWRGDSKAPWEQSHYTYLIRTFWIGLVGFVVSLVLTVVLIGIPMLIAVAVWVIIRSIVSLLKAQKHEPMPDPATLGI